MVIGLGVNPLDEFICEFVELKPVGCAWRAFGRVGTKPDIPELSGTRAKTVNRYA
jgi:hypothetical protein